MSIENIYTQMINEDHEDNRNSTDSIVQLMNNSSGGVVALYGLGNEISNDRSIDVSDYRSEEELRSHLGRLFSSYSVATPNNDRVREFANTLIQQAGLDEDANGVALESANEIVIIVDSSELQH